MNATIEAMIAAAAEARRRSSGERVIDIVVTEMGFVVRGRTFVNGRERRTSNDRTWEEFAGHHDMLLQAVLLVDRQLERAE